MTALPALLGTSAEAAQRIAERGGQPPDEARRIAAEGIKSGAFKAWWVGPTADHRRLAAPEELTDEAIGLDDGRPALIREDDPGDGFSLGFRILLPSLEISLADVEDCCDRWFGQKATLSAAPPKGAGGRPAKHKWERATAQVLLRVRDIGLPATQAELVDELLDWFTANYREIPDRRATERFVADIWPREPRTLGAPE